MILFAMELCGDQAQAARAGWPLEAGLGGEEYEMLLRDVTAPCRHEWSWGSECYCLLWKHAGTRTRLHALAGLWRPDWGVRSTNAVA